MMAEFLATLFWYYAWVKYNYVCQVQNSKGRAELMFSNFMISLHLENGGTQGLSTGKVARKYRNTHI